MRKALILVLALLPALGLCTTTTGGGGVDLSSGITVLGESLQATLANNAAAIFGIAAIFVGVSFVIWLFKKFTGGASS